MEYLIGRLHSFLTGGQSDFFIPLSHQWHGVNVAPVLYAVAAAGFLGLLYYGAIGLWRVARHKPAALPFLIAMLYATAAYAASSTLGNLSAGTTITDTDLFYDVQSVGTGGVKVTGAQLKTYLGTTVQTGAGATGGTCSPGSTCTIQTLETPVVRTSGNYTTSDRAELIQYNSASDQSPTLPSASSMGAGGVIDTCSIQHSQTITPNSGIPDTIGGASTYSLATGTAAAPTCVRLISNGVSDWKPTFIPGNASSPAGLTPMYTGVAGTYYSTFNGTGNAGAAQASGKVCFTPIFIAAATTWEGMVANVTTAYSGTGNGWAMALYASGTGISTHTATNRPDGSALASTTFQTGTSTSNQTVAFSSHLSITTPGWYWLAFEYGDATQAIATLGSIGSGATATFSPGTFMGSTDPNSVTWSGLKLGVIVAGSGGTLPTLTSSTTFTENATTNNSCALGLEIFSVP